MMRRLACLLTVCCLSLCPVLARDFATVAQQAETARQAQHDEDALRLYGEALALKPDWPEGLWFEGILLYGDARYGEALDPLRHLLALDANNGPGLVVLGLSEYQTRQYERALSHLQHGLALGLGDRTAMAQSGWYFVSVLLTRFAHFDEALDLLFDRGRMGPPGDTFFVPAGLAGLRLALTPEEVTAERRPVIEAAGRAIVTLYGERNLGAATEQLKQLAATYPNESGVHFLYGACVMPNDPETGVAEMKRELEITPDHLAAQVALADEYLREQKVDLALAVAQAAVRFNEEESPAHLVLGEVFTAEGKLDDAIAELQKAEAQSPGVARIHFALSKAFRLAKKPADAAREQAAFESLNEPPK